MTKERGLDRYRLGSIQPDPDLEGRQGIHRHVQIFLVKPVQLAIHRVEENETVEPADQIMLVHLHAHMGRRAADHEFAVKLLVGILFGK